MFNFEIQPFQYIAILFTMDGKLEIAWLRGGMKDRELFGIDTDAIGSWHNAHVIIFAVRIGEQVLAKG